jgi:tRNA pseudouridine38-40 synthase
MALFKIVVAYDGTDCVGWQRQANGVSIQGLIEDALRVLDERDVPLHGAGRTDAGVHALGQVASFDLQRALPAGAIVRALNARLPGAIRVLSAEEAAPDFHPRFSARRKTYRYRIWHADAINPFESRYAWHVPGQLNVDAMRDAAALIAGRHDFAAFQAAGGSTVTTVREIFESRVKLSGELLTYEVTGDGFLRYMVRTIVGSLVEIGRGRQPVDWIGRVLAAGDRALAGPTAPPHGLFLVCVGYGAAVAGDS